MLFINFEERRRLRLNGVASLDRDDPLLAGYPEGQLIVRVHADVREAVTESSEDNNVATVKIRITGDTVTVVPHSSTGGIP